MLQFVYKMNLNDKPNSNFSPQADDIKPDVFYNIFDAIKYLPSLIKRFGVSSELLKLLLKLVLKRDAFYCLIINKKIVSDGLITFGRCNYYDVGKQDCIIGTVYSEPSYRGKGLATTAIQSCISNLIVNRPLLEAVYIDTSENNIGMQKVIDRLGFGQPFHTYERHQS
ncbi:hypothetical protein NBRC116592_36790 [Colwellia sp. KU-HH00111]|uniref:GNAT family N-acetyltransferase n=1 Tax=Colwellia sp. KU-HH00111 TaxID=3127652 RepID=UPI003102214C